MPTENINSQPQAGSTVGNGAGHTASEELRTNILHTGEMERIGMLSADPKGIITGCNQTAVDIFGETHAELLGRPLATLFLRKNPAEQKRLQQTILAAVLKDGQHRYSLRSQTKSGESFAAES